VWLPLQRCGQNWFTIALFFGLYQKEHYLLFVVWDKVWIRLRRITAPIVGRFVGFKCSN